MRCGQFMPRSASAARAALIASGVKFYFAKINTKILLLAGHGIKAAKQTHAHQTASQ